MRGANLRSVYIGVGAFAAALLIGVPRAQAQEATRLRELSGAQYAQIIADVFGPTIEVNKQLEVANRDYGLLEVGKSQTTVNPARMEAYERSAKRIAEQVFSADNLTLFVPCAENVANKWDARCASGFIASAGELLFRRPLSQQELSSYLSIAERVSQQSSGILATGLRYSLENMLVSPQFLFRWETTDSRSGKLDDYTVASRLSFFLWNSGPDRQLLQAAKSGKLRTAVGIASQADRMLVSTRLESSVRAFFIDLLHFEDFDELTKDATIYPKFSSVASKDAQEQTLRTIVDHLVVRDQDYRDLFTTRRTFLTPALGAIYKVTAPSTSPNGTPDKWVPFEFPENDPRAGILTHVSFSTLHSHPGRSSPTLRGKALREIFLCQRVPDPPGNVDFTVVQDTSNPIYKTARARLEAHATNPACTGCHKLTDPAGLALEIADGGGGFRSKENGVQIDTSGDFNGKRFSGIGELGVILRNDPTPARCIANRFYAYALGRSGEPPKEVATRLSESFAANGYKIKPLLREIILSADFIKPVVPPAVSKMANATP